MEAQVRRLQLLMARGKPAAGRGALSEVEGPMDEAAALRLAPLVLAYVGDAVFDLHIRTNLVLSGPAKVGDLHRRAVSFVRATAQAEALRGLQPTLTEAEADIVRRARNAKSSHVPRGVDPAQYAMSTGFEALLGYLYLTGQGDRLYALLTAAVAAGQPPVSQ